ncbi:MAG TPA: universal stress protein [Hanamia sp.]|nr:universal stress protein [Hanamia sp.]
MKDITEKITKKEITYNVATRSYKEKKIKTKKFLAVFDGFKFSESTMEYAIHLTKESDAFLVGVFLDEFIYRSYNVSKIVTSYKNDEQILKQMDAKDKEKRDETVKQFERTCDQAGIHYSFHRNTGVAIQELKQESIFADLIIINDTETFNRFAEEPPTRFIKELLSDVQCPVLIVPDIFKPVDKITLLYDGGPSSVFAIKMFSYLFGDLHNVPVEVFTVKDKMEGSHLPSSKLMREFIKRHFPKAKYILEKGNAEEHILGHLRYHKGNEMVVLGAYRRSEISRWFKTSMADILMRELDTPLFIAHNK